MYQQNYALAENIRSKSFERINSISEELKPKRIDLIRECMFDIESLASLQLSILKSARNELDLDFDENRFRDILNEAVRKNKTALNAYLDFEQ